MIYQCFTNVLTMFYQCLTINSKLQMSISDCHQVDIDLVFVLDASSSVTSENFEEVKNFTKDLLSTADIDNGNARVGVNVFSSGNKVAFNLNTYDNKDDVFGAIDAIRYTGGGTYTPGALKTVRTEMFTVANGDRAGVNNIAIVVTDGVSKGDPIKSADEARSEGIHIFVIGIGFSMNIDQLKGMANKPAEDNLFLIDDFNALDAIKEQVFEAVCGKSLKL